MKVPICPSTALQRSTSAASAGITLTIRYKKQRATKTRNTSSSSLNSFGTTRRSFRKSRMSLSKISPPHTAKMRRSISTFSPFIIFFMSSWTTFPRTSFQTRRQALRKVKFGGCYITSSAMPYLLSSASWKSITAVSLRTASASVKRSPRLPSLSITKTATSPFLFSARKNYPKTGIPIRAITSITPLRRTGCATMCCIIPTFRAAMVNRTALTLTA